MDELVLVLHSWLRWAALLSGLAAISAAIGLRAGERGERADRWGRIFTVTLDVQLLLGFLLYFALSPVTPPIFDDLGAAMGDPVARFWAVEHVSLMLLAVLGAHIGRVLSRKARTPAAKRTRLLTCFGLATLCLILGTPWPGMTAGRPLFRF
jgi:hypothetical protein